MHNVELHTSAGPITLELNEDEAPETTRNFLEYVDSGFYEGTLFHRVIPGFVIQGGGMTPEMGRKPTRDPIRNEADNGLKNTRGTICMARTPDPHSATSQFFINLRDNTNLDHTSPDPKGWGYCVFGKVVDGMDTVDAIAAAQTGNRAGHADVPLQDIVIEHAVRAES